MKTVYIPTINDQPWDFDKLFSIERQCQFWCEEYRFDFSSCRFLRPNAVAFLGGLARRVESYGGRVHFLWDTLNLSVRTSLMKNGFMPAFGNFTSFNSGNSVPYREDRILDASEIVNFLKVNWLGRGWVQVSPLLRDAIVGRVWEIYANAAEHGHSHVGIYSCGQHFPHMKELKLSVVDFGIGIPTKVRNYFAQLTGLRSDSCMRWAFQRGASTNSGGIGRGLGLDLLKAFVSANSGSLEVYSNDGYARIDSSQEIYEVRQSSFPGTIFNISLTCNEAYYRFASEVVNQPLF